LREKGRRCAGSPVTLELAGHLVELAFKPRSCMPGLASRPWPVTECGGPFMRWIFILRARVVASAVAAIRLGMRG
jgi:hypothetical protein